MAASEIRAGRAYVELFVKGNIKGALERTEKQLRQLGSSVTAIGKNMAAVGAAAVGGLLAAAKQFASMGDEITKASERTGIAVETLSALKYAADQSGTSLEDVEKAALKMSKNIVEAANGSKSASDALNQLGLSVQDLQGLSPDEQFLKVAESLSKITDENEKAAYATEIFGKSGANLLPMLKDGAAGIASLTKRARELGLVISKEDAAAATKFGDALDDLWKQVKMVTFQIGAAVAHALQPYADAATRIMAKVIAWVKENRKLVTVVLAVAAAVAIAGAVFIGLGTTITLIGVAVGGIVKGFSLIASAIALLTNPIVLVGLALAGLTAYFLLTTKTGGNALKWLGNKFTALKQIAGEALGGIADALMAGELQLAAKILWTGLQLAWLEGTRELQKLWIQFKAAFTKTAIEAFYGAMDAWVIVKAGLETMFASTTAFFVKSWWDAVYEVTKAFDFLERAEREKEKNRIKRDQASGKITQEQADKQVANVDAQANQVLAARDKKDSEDAALREIDLQETLAEIQAERDRKLSENVDAEKALTQGNAANADKDIADLEAKRNQLQEELNALRGEAKGKRDIVDEENKNKQKDKKAPTFNMASGPGATGLFNVAALQSLMSGGANSSAERTAKATEDTSKNVRKLVDRATSGGLVFS